MINRWLGALPSTNFRIFVTMLLAVITTLRYVASGIGVSARGMHVDTWTPSGEWLLFLTALAGIDVAQFATKRTTSAEHVAAKQPQVTAQTAEVLAERVTVNEADT